MAEQKKIKVTVEIEGEPTKIHQCGHMVLFAGNLKEDDNIEIWNHTGCSARFLEIVSENALVEKALMELTIRKAGELFGSDELARAIAAAVASLPMDKIEAALDRMMASNKNKDNLH
jgi:xanthine dehydrogenase molybdopterin-binding subunit B